MRTEKWDDEAATSGDDSSAYCIVRRLTGRLLDMTGPGCTAVTCLTTLIETTALWVRNDVMDWEAE